jgi:hypothetical protein
MKDALTKVADSIDRNATASEHLVDRLTVRNRITAIVAVLLLLSNGFLIRRNLINTPKLFEGQELLASQLFCSDELQINLINAATSGNRHERNRTIALLAQVDKICRTDTPDPTPLDGVLPDGTVLEGIPE